MMANNTASSSSGGGGGNGDHSSNNYGHHTAKIPRIELTRERSSTLESIQSLTRAIRESLRLHSVRREKKRRAKKAAKNVAGASSSGGGGTSDDGTFLDVKDANRRMRSRSMDDGEGEIDITAEISDVVVSAVVVSDIGPVTDHMLTNEIIHQTFVGENHSNIATDGSNTSDNSTTATTVTPETANANTSSSFEDAKNSASVDAQAKEYARGRRHSKSVDEYELAHMRRNKNKMNASGGGETVEQDQQEGDKTSGQSTQTQQHQQMSLDLLENNTAGKQQPSRQYSMPTTASDALRRHSKDDTAIDPRQQDQKVDASVLRKRFARLLESLRSHKFSISSAETGSGSGGGGGGSNGNNSATGGSSGGGELK